MKDTYEVHGEPTSVQGARALAKHDRFQFQAWSLGLVDARLRRDSKKGGDRGIDGRLNFFDDDTEISKKIFFQVKSGKHEPSDVRDLVGVLAREENAEIGVFITLDEPTKGMRQEAADAGYYRSQISGLDHPRIQILTVASLLAAHRRHRDPLDAPIIRSNQEKIGRRKPELAILLGLPDEGAKTAKHRRPRRRAG